MPKITTRFVEGQSITIKLNSGKNLTDATIRRIYYKIPDGSGGFITSFWDATMVDTTYCQFTIHNVKSGNYSAFPHGEFPDGSIVSRSADPAQWRVWKIHEL